MSRVDQDTGEIGTLGSLRHLSPTEFEHFVADVFSGLGWRTTVTQAQGDRGVDIIAERDSPVYTKAVIQAKRYGPNSTVGSPEIQQYSSLRQQEDADIVIVVTTSTFSKQASKIADQLRVRLVDGNRLVELMDEAVIQRRHSTTSTPEGEEPMIEFGALIPLYVHAVMLIYGVVSPIVIFPAFILLIALSQPTELPLFVPGLFIPGIVGLAILVYLRAVRRSVRRTKQVNLPYQPTGWPIVGVGMFSAGVLYASNYGLNPINPIAFGVSVSGVFSVWEFYYRLLFD